MLESFWIILYTAFSLTYILYYYIEHCSLVFNMKISVHALGITLYLLLTEVEGNILYAYYNPSLDAKVNNNSNSNIVKRQVAWNIVGWASPDCTNEVLWAIDGDNIAGCDGSLSEVASYSFQTFYGSWEAAGFLDQYCTYYGSYYQSYCVGTNCCYNGALQSFFINPA
jgi:hypothetical protein